MAGILEKLKGVVGKPQQQGNTSGRRVYENLKPVLTRGSAPAVPDKAADAARAAAAGKPGRRLGGFGDRKARFRIKAAKERGTKGVLDAIKPLVKPGGSRGAVETLKPLLKK